MQLYAGIDVGSRTIGFVTLSGTEVKDVQLEDTGHEPWRTAKGMLKGKFDRVIATGYGRHTAVSHFAQGAITEIKAHALGVRHLFPQARTVLDMGGQDTKVILLGAGGAVIDFQMNDKCSAGTGKFLEVMSAALGYSQVGQFGEGARGGRGDVKISSMCTVFAESEAVSLLHRGVNRQDIGLALHRAVVERAAGMVERSGWNPPLVFTGGVAKNQCIVKMLEKKLGTGILVPVEPQLVGALGAALAAAE